MKNRRQAHASQSNVAADVVHEPKPPFSNAAHQQRSATLEDVSDADLDETLKTNVYAYFRLARAALRYMEPGAAIIATSSVTGLRGSKASDPGLTPAEVATFGSHAPFGRPAQPEEIAPAYVFLASNADSPYITGTVLQILGGEATGG